ncbi:MAG: DUF2871 domain-containing protein [Oscillospiraceae bacterium]|jgi:membrane-associated HD superfamily phosphohydrolase|nr:DUF2871 domain-containing protein [Oscillospiraceae bacterium]
MKKYINLSFLYAVAAIACGVFYREFTKFYGFTGRTTLAFTHVHLFLLGTVVFLLIALFSDKWHLESQKSFRCFMVLYPIGLPFMVVMLFVRGIHQVLVTSLSAGASAAISGMAGISHTILTISIVLLFTALRKCAGTESR